MKNKIHNTADVKATTIGSNVTIWQFSVVIKGAKIGNGVNINAHCLIEDNVEIGDNTTIKSGVYLWSGTRIENNVFIGPNVTFSNDKYPRSKNRDFKLEAITLRHHCSIGAGATILPGIEIGRYAMVGAGSVVVKDVPVHSIVFGNPAKISGYICDCGSKNSSRYCEKCNKKL